MFDSASPLLVYVIFGTVHPPSKVSDGLVTRQKTLEPKLVIDCLHHLQMKIPHPDCRHSRYNQQQRRPILSPLLLFLWMMQRPLLSELSQVPLLIPFCVFIFWQFFKVNSYMINVYYFKRNYPAPYGFGKNEQLSPGV